MAERITITIETDNAAFDDEPASEIARILKCIAWYFENEGILSDTPRGLMDANGNRCGCVKIEPL